MRALNMPKSQATIDRTCCQSLASLVGRGGSSAFDAHFAAAFNLAFNLPTVFIRQKVAYPQREFAIWISGSTTA